MSRTVLGAATAMIGGVLEETEDPEKKYKLRSALQLLTILEDNRAQTRTLLGEADLDPGLAERLGELGYLD